MGGQRYALVAVITKRLPFIAATCGTVHCAEASSTIQRIEEPYGNTLLRAMKIALEKC